MMNFFFGEHNGKLKQAAKQKPLLRLFNLRKPGPALGSPLLLDLRKLLLGDPVPARMPLKSPCDARWDAGGAPGGCRPGRGLCRDPGTGVLGTTPAVSRGAPSSRCGWCHRDGCHEYDLCSVTRGACSWGSYKFIPTWSKGFSSALGKEGGFGKLEINRWPRGAGGNTAKQRRWRSRGWDGWSLHF